MHSRRLCAFWMERFTEFCRKQPELRVSFRVNISLSKMWIMPVTQELQKKLP